MTTRPRPPYDAEMTAAVQSLFDYGHEADAAISRLRADYVPPLVDVQLHERSVAISEHVAPGLDGHGVALTVLRPSEAAKRPGAAVFMIHGGGMVCGDRLSGSPMLADWVEQYGAVCASVEYRLAPEFPDPVPVEDCYAGLVWFARQAEELGFDPHRILVVGASAGGGLAAGTVLLARDRKGPPVAAQMLLCPMLDDRNETSSSWQFSGVGGWDRELNLVGWSAYLGERRGSDDVSIYAAPGRATDLSGLPPTFLDVGSAEVFRDETVAFASRIWDAGGVADLHVWAGGFHGYEGAAPAAASSVQTVLTREAWIRRYLAS